LHPGLVALAYLLVVALADWVFPVQVELALLLTLPVSLWAVFTFWRQDTPVSSALAMAAFLLAAATGWGLVGSVK
jgi:hypothetical protein